MNALQRYTIIIESLRPPVISLGDNIGGGEVVELKKEPKKLVSAAELARKYNVSARTVNRKLAVINQGTDGKSLYDPEMAHQLLTTGDNKVGRKRKN